MTREGASRRSTRRGTAASTRSPCRPTGAASRWASVWRAARWASGSSSSTGAVHPAHVRRTGPAAGVVAGRADRRVHPRTRSTTSIVFSGRSTAARRERLLARLDRQIQEVGWSPDGRWLLLRTDNGGPGAGDIVGVRTSGDTTPVPLVASHFTELHPAVSPDGRWLAYTSIESGEQRGLRPAVSRPRPARRWQVSNGGGSQPRWSSDGRRVVLSRQRESISRRAGPGGAGRSRSPSSSRCSTLRGFPTSSTSRTTCCPAAGASSSCVRGRRVRRRRGGVVEAENWFADVRARMRH